MSSHVGASNVAGPFFLDRICIDYESAKIGGQLRNRANEAKIQYGKRVHSCGKDKKYRDEFFF